MFSDRMDLKSVFCKLLLWTSISIALAYDVSLPSGVSQFIPSCAVGCVESFISLNWDISICGSTPSLQCLCSHQTASGYAIGEGAVQCIVAENEVGACASSDAASTVVVNAYRMCNGQVSALPNTHATLSATLEVPTSGAGIIIIATPTSSTPPNTATTPTTLLTSPGTTTAVPTSGSKTAASATTAASTSTAKPQPAQTSSSPPASLNTAQVAGITVGVAGAFGIAIGLILLARHNRKRHYAEFDDGSFRPMKDDKSSFGSTANRLTRIFHISPPILRVDRPITPQPPPPPPQNRASGGGRDTIGLAISRPRSEVPARPPNTYQPPRSSPIARDLLPNFSPIKLTNTPPSVSPESARPKPPRAETRPPKLVINKPALTLTIPSQATARTQSSQGPQTDRTSTLTNATAFADLDTEADGTQVWRPPPTDPQSANTYYVADKWGNWVLAGNRRSQAAEIQEVAELDTYTPLTKSPLEKAEEAAKAAAMAGAISAASAFPNRPQLAFLSQDPARPGISRSSSIYSQASAVRPNIRQTQQSLNRNNSWSRRGNPTRINRTDSKMSQGSATSFESMSSSPVEPNTAGFEPDPNHLSQLSPVVEMPSPSGGRSQVTYPKIPGRLDNATMRSIPPPRRPNFASSPPGQPSPTLGAVLPVKSSPGAYPAPLNPRRLPQGPGAGSGFSPSPPTIPDFPTPPQQRPRLNTEVPSRPHIASLTSPQSATTTSSAASSLLAKRLGNERAAALALDGSIGPGKSGPWRRQDGNGFLSPQMMGGPGNPQPKNLPSTPTWQPKLTPTRRGDDLFLNVQ